MITATTAYTGVDGRIHYDLIDPKNDSTLFYDFRSLVKNNGQRVKVGAKEKKSFVLDLGIPEIKSYRGQILGAVTVYQLSDQEKIGKKTKAGVTNHFAMGFPVALNFGGEFVPVNSIDDPFKLDVVKPGFGLRGGLAILADLRNTKPVQCLDFEVDATVTPKGKNKVLFHTKQSGLQMAPNSIYNYQIYWNTKDGFRAGKYHLAMNIKMPGTPGPKTYHLKRDFTVTASDAKKYNAKVGIKPNYVWLYILVGVIVLILLLLLTYFLSRRYSKRK